MSPGTTSRTCSKVSRGGGGGRVKEGVQRAGCVRAAAAGSRRGVRAGAALGGACEARGCGEPAGAGCVREGAAASRACEGRGCGGRGQAAAPQR